MAYAKLNFENVRAYALLGVVGRGLASICECILGFFHFASRTRNLQGLIYNPCFTFVYNLYDDK